MRSHTLPDLSRIQAQRRAAFQRQILTDIRDYFQERTPLPPSTRNGLDRLESTLAQSIRELELRSQDAAEALAV